MRFLFWDLHNNEPEILSDDGQFYYYGEDAVAIKQGDEENGRYWSKLNKFRDITPLNTYDRFLFYSERVGDFIPWGDAEPEEIRQVHRAAKDPEWRTVE